MSTRLMVAAATAALGLAGSVVATHANAACAVSALDAASSTARASAFAQFAGGIQATAQARAATALTSLPNFNAPGARGSIVERAHTWSSYNVRGSCSDWGTHG